MRSSINYRMRYQKAKSIRNWRSYSDLTNPYTTILTAADGPSHAIEVEIYEGIALEGEFLKWSNIASCQWISLFYTSSHSIGSRTAHMINIYFNFIFYRFNQVSLKQERNVRFTKLIVTSLQKVFLRYTFIF